MTVEQMARLLNEEIRFENWQFNVCSNEARTYMQVVFMADGEVQFGRKWLLSKHMTKSELVQTAFKAVLTALEHEAREHFLYRGKPIFGPHYDVDALHEIVERTDAREDP